MKKSIILIVVGIALIPVAIFVIKLSTKKTASANSDYLRIHIRANSNQECDQNVKYKVKEKVVEFLTPHIAKCHTFEESKNVIKSHLNDICAVANQTLKENGFNYTARAEIRTENFPTRSYGSLTLNQGTYEALILELGTGTGDNWWCVMFPPLCFIDAKGQSQNSTTYRSKIWEIIQKYC